MAQDSRRAAGIAPSRRTSDRESRLVHKRVTESIDGTERCLSFLSVSARAPKPRKTGVTEIRGPYYTPVTYQYLKG